MIDLIPDQVFGYHSYYTESSSLDNVICKLDIFDDTQHYPEFLIKKIQLWIWLITLKDLRIHFISILHLSKYFSGNPRFIG